MKTCINRKGGMCQVEIYPKKCERDYVNHPNNGDCPIYYEVNIMEFEVKEKAGGLSKKL
jgi:hypothetical protein